MTPKEAIDNIAEIQGIITDVIPVCDPNDDLGRYTITLNVAIKALEKQIPKKPINVQDCYIPETYDYDYSIANCPNCRMAFSFDEYHRPLYCNKCGQAIDWSEKE